jgi:hypothetical protein
MSSQPAGGDVLRCRYAGSLGHCRFFPHQTEEKESCFLNNLKSMFFIDYGVVIGIGRKHG